MANRRSPEEQIREMLARESFREFDWNFEGAADQLKSGVTMSTLRKDHYKYQSVLPGDIITANCVLEEEKVPLIVLDIKAGVVDDLPLLYLALDGYLNHREALERMQDFYNGFDETTEARLLLFMTVENFTRLSRKQQIALMRTNYYPETETVGNPLLRDIFFPPIASWIAHHHGNAEDYHQYLLETRLVDQLQIDKVLRAYNRIVHGDELQGQIMERILGRDFGQLVQSRKFDNAVYSWTVLLRKPRRRLT